VRGKARILVVEDDLLLAETLSEHLLEWGFEPVPAVSVDAALSLILESRIDAAFLDVRLRHELSYPVAYALRDRGIPFLFLTSYGRPDFPPDLRSFPLIEKPFQLRALRAALRSLLQG
jgi:DNA-binding response OmpR family regulator